MFDSVDVAEIPRDAPAVAGYTSGHWPTFPELERRFPKAHRLSIAVTARRDADCLDVEPGDATPSEVVAWVTRQHARGVARPVVYSSVSAFAQIIAGLQRAGLYRNAYRIWSAHYTGRAHICGPHTCGQLLMDADGTQWTDRSRGRNLDESLLRDDFFAATSSGKAVLTGLERREVELYDRLAVHPHLHPVGLRKVRRRLVVLRKEVWLAAHGEIKRGKPPAEAWRFRNRQARYTALWHRTRGLG